MMKNIRLLSLLSLCLASGFFRGEAQSLPSFGATQESYPTLQVTGTARLNIIPDRITVEIGIEEYYKSWPGRDSLLVKLPEIEKDIRKTLEAAGVADSSVIVTDVGNFRNPARTRHFFMAKRLSVVVSSFQQLDKLAGELSREGITSFQIIRMDNSRMADYNRKGLKAALDAARNKADFIAENEQLRIGAPWEIIENQTNPAGGSPFSNVAFDNGEGMGEMRRIVRNYSVTVKYLYIPLHHDR